jgi:putative transposase
LNAAQQYLRYPEEDYNDTTEKWLDTIEGKGPYAAETNPRKPDREKQGYIATPRHLATIVNAEPPFQEYLIATIQLLGNTDFDENLPFTSRDHGRVFDYTDTGPVGLLDMITRAGRQALLAAFFQKWRVHLRCRPETYSGRIYGSYKAKTSPFRAGIQPTNPLLTMFNTLPDIPRPVVTFTTLIVISAYEHSSMLETTRTYRAKLVNYQQVSDDLDDCGHSASKLWNVARYYSQQEWDDNGEIPSEADLKRELKDHERYSDLHSQSSQRVLEELAESFSGWLKKRKNGDTDVNPPGYRKRGDTHPRSTVTWKQNGIKHDSKHNQLRLSKGFNLKTHRSDFILAEYETRPDVTVENIQQVRAVWNGDRWELHLVCKVEIPVEDAPGDNTAGIDLGISNYLAIAYDDGDAELYPGNVLKQDKHYFTRDEYDTEGENGPSRRALRARQKLSRRKDHFLHALAKHVVEQCIDHEVGRIAIGELSKMREDENGDSRNWGKRGNKKLHGWEFDRFTRLLEYKAEEHGILVDRTSERDTSKTCSCCGRKRDANRVERGLYVCKSCGATMNADVNGAVNIRRKITQSPPTEDMSNGRLARPVAYLFNQTSGRFAPSERVGCEP